MKRKILLNTAVVLLLPVIYYFMLTGIKKNDSNENNILSINTSKRFDEVIFNDKYFTLPEEPYNRDFYSDRCRTAFLCYARRIEINSINEDTSKHLNSLYFKNTAGDYTVDKGYRVIHAAPDKKYPHGFILAQNITYGKENILNDNLEKDSGTWYIKPKLRINKDDFDNMDTDPVAAVVIYNCRNEKVDSVIIQVRNFSDMSGTYDGEYRDKYLFDIGHDLEFAGHKLFGGFKKEKLPQIKIYWFGLYEVWFSKIIIDDYKANSLFGNMPGNYDEHIRQSATAENYLLVLSMLRQYKPDYAQMRSANYVLNIMYNNIFRIPYTE